MTETPPETLPPIFISGNADPGEALLEAREINKYLLAKTFFDCREFDRCSAVFLPDTLLTGLLSATSTKSGSAFGTPKGKGKSTSRLSQSGPALGIKTRKLSQKSLFLALYAKMMAGEKRKDEESEMIMGPHDSGKATNKELLMVSRFLENWFASRMDENGEAMGSQGWLEYL